MIWTDYDHVVPDWKSLMELGFQGILERAKMYRNKHIQNETMTEEMAAFFEGIEIQYTAIINLIDRMYNEACGLNFEKANSIARCLKNFVTENRQIFTMHYSLFIFILLFLNQ